MGALSKEKAGTRPTAISVVACRSHADGCAYTMKELAARRVVER
jgi:hypothetical protein